MGSTQNAQEKHKFDFDMWYALSQSDPQAFEELRQKTLDNFIGGVDDDRQHRLRCLQWKVDRVREMNPTPLAACVAISDMMWDSLEKLNQIYYDYNSITTLQGSKRELAPLPNASILNFKLPKLQ